MPTALRIRDREDVLAPAGAGRAAVRSLETRSAALVFFKTGTIEIA